MVQTGTVATVLGHFCAINNAPFRDSKDTEFFLYSSSKKNSDFEVKKNLKKRFVLKEDLENSTYS